jgi:hypothetical protein
MPTEKHGFENRKDPPSLPPSLELWRDKRAMARQVTENAKNMSANGRIQINPFALLYFVRVFRVVRGLKYFIRTAIAVEKFSQ